VAIDESRPFLPVAIAILTVSDTRTRADDRSGDILVARLTEAGHRLADRDIVVDDADLIAARMQRWIDDAQIDCVIATGGTGVTGRDVTPEALDRVCEKKIPGFGELFRWISFQKIGTSTSTGACRDGWDEILVHQLDNRFRPCNFVELMPRLQEK